MSALATLQRKLQRLIVDGDDVIASAIESSAAIPATTRLRIYSDAYRLRLIEALQANYPALERLVGADRFARLTQLYLSMNPSRHFSIRWFGHELASFLREFDECRDEPWLAELAEWEWKVATAFDASDAESLTASSLADLAPEAWPTLTFALHPSVQRIRLLTNAATIAKAAGADLSLPVPERFEPGQLDASRHGTPWLIWRQDLVVRFRSLDAMEAAALDAVESGSTFGELCEAIAEYLDADAVPQQAATYLRTWIDERLLATNLHR
jgi:hypothetical protein